MTIAGAAGMAFSVVADEGPRYGMGMRATVIALCLLAGCVTRVITAREFDVLRVIDGDTFVVMYDGEPTSCRIYGIDAPERGQPGAAEATAALTREIAGKRVRLTFPARHKRDNFGRLLVTYHVLTPTR